jgi:hypothetical protein
VIRHDAHNDYEVFGEHGPEDPDFQGMDFPLPVQGNQSPNILALGMLAKISFVFGIFMLLIRLIGLSHPDIAVILSYVFAAAFGIALGIKLFAPGRGMMEWPVWIGAAIVLFFAVNRWLPVLDVPLRQNAGSQNVIPMLFQLGIILLVIVIYLSPSVRNLLTTKTPGPLAVGAVGCLLGGRCAALDYFPESDFGAWIYFAMMLLIAWTVINCVTDQYVRFEKATNPSLEGDGVSTPAKALFGLFPTHFSLMTPFAIPVSLWIGNLAFLCSLHLRGANTIGFAAFIASLLGFGVLSITVFRTRRLQANPILAAWNALTFWLTYNLQRNANPNVFQCVPWFREPLVRFGLTGVAIMALGLSVLHLSGVHASAGRNKQAPEESFTFVWRYVTPQCYPGMLAKMERNPEAKAIYDRWSDTVVKTGDAPMPPHNPVRTVGDFLFSVILFFLGGPLLFFFLLVTTQGAFIASQIGQVEEDESLTRDS